MKLATRVYNLQLLYRRQLCTSNLLSYAHKHEISAVISNKSLQWKNLYNLPFHNLRSLSKYFHQSCVVPLHHSQLLQKESVTSREYEHISNEVLENLTEKLEFLLEEDNAPSECDITFSSGVLTLKLGKHGTYVINKQSPNKQIWLSSPLSGPKRYDFIENDWVYKHDKSFLFDLLSQELSTIFNKDINLRDETIYSDLKL
ncbi:UNVERIFIED_CONTAM: hypothetical protein RMT77_018775 [Armadillidium vulgare]